MALIVIPYFKVNIEADGLFLKDRQKRLRIFYIVAIALSLFLLLFKVYAALVPTLIMAGIMLVAAQSSPQSPSAFRRYLAGQAVVLLGDDLVLIRIGGAHRHRNILPRTGLGIRLAVAGLIHTLRMHTLKTDTFITMSTRMLIRVRRS